MKRLVFIGILIIIVCGSLLDGQEPEKFGFTGEYTEFCLMQLPPKMEIQKNMPLPIQVWPIMCGLSETKPTIEYTFFNSGLLHGGKVWVGVIVANLDTRNANSTTITLDVIGDFNILTPQFSKIKQTRIVPSNTLQVYAWQINLDPYYSGLYTINAIINGPNTLAKTLQNRCMVVIY